jgi:hypothetical protein
MSTARLQARICLLSLVVLAAGCSEDADLPGGPDTGATADTGASPADAAAASDTAPTPDALATADASASPDVADLPADAAATESGSPADADTPDATPTCASCYREAIASGRCKLATPGACDDIPADGVGAGKTAGDKALCQAVDECMRTSACWTAEKGVVNCICGTAAGLACAGPAANGACKAQILAATRSTSELQAASLVFSTMVPAGFAAQKYECYHDQCATLCK